MFYIFQFVFLAKIIYLYPDIPTLASLPREGKIITSVTDRQIGYRHSIIIYISSPGSYDGDKITKETSSDCEHINPLLSQAFAVHVEGLVMIIISLFVIIFETYSI